MVLIGYQRCVIIYGLALFLEMFSEPLYVLSGMQNRIKLRVIIESSAMIARVSALFVMVVLAGMGLTAFAWAQLIYAMVMVMGFYIAYGCESRHNRPAMGPGLSSPQSSWFDSSMAQTTKLFTVQSLQKLILTEGEKMVMVVLYQNPAGQGVYGLVQNLGECLTITM